MASIPRAVYQEARPAGSSDDNSRCSSGHGFVSSSASSSSSRLGHGMMTYASENTPLLPGMTARPRGRATTTPKSGNLTLAYYTDKLAIKSDPSLTNAQLMLTNPDLLPVEPSRRQWRSRNFTAFWIADSFNINTWMIASASILNGLSWWQAWLCVWIGYAIAGCFICLTGRIGATYHVAFPVVARPGFGVWGSLWPVLNRAAMACVWYGVQSWIGGSCVYLMIRSVWPSWDDYAAGGSRNAMPVWSGTNTRDLVSFLLFWIGSLPFLWFPVHKIRHLFTVKAYIVPTASLSFFLWALIRAKGLGPILHQPAKAHGPDLIWALIKAIMCSIANFATLIISNPDFSRFARSPSSALWSQLLTIPSGFALTSIIGIIVSSSSSVIYGQPIWSPLDLLQNFLAEDAVSSGTRFGVFVIAAAFSLAQLGTNVAANSVSAGTDMSALFPRFLNIRRGSYVCAIVGLGICPWHLLSSSNNFTTYLSAYSVFLSSIAGVIVSDYYFVRKGYLQTGDLYSAMETGAYYYSHGVHWRGYAAYICGILVNVVGLAGAVGWKVQKGATYIYNFNFFAGFIISGTIYWILCKLSPIPATSDVWLEVEEVYTGCEEGVLYSAADSDSEHGKPDEEVKRFLAPG